MSFLSVCLEIIPSVFKSLQFFPANGTPGASCLLLCFLEKGTPAFSLILCASDTLLIHYFCASCVSPSSLCASSPGFAHLSGTSSPGARVSLCRLQLQNTSWHVNSVSLQSWDSRSSKLHPPTPSGFLHLTLESRFSPKLTFEAVLPKPPRLAPDCLVNTAEGLSGLCGMVGLLRIICLKLTMSKWRSKEVKGLVKSYTVRWAGS